MPDVSTQTTIETLHSGTQTTDDSVNFSIKATGDGRKQISEQVSGGLEQTNLERNDSAMESKHSTHNRKRNVPSDEMESHVPKQSRLEISIASQQVATISNEECSVNPYSPTDASGTRDQIELNKRQSISISSESRNIEESQSQNPSVQVHENLEPKKLLITGQNSASNKNISNKEVPESYGSKKEAGISVDILAVPGPSHPRENVPQSNLSKDELQNLSTEQSVEEMKEMPIGSTYNIGEDSASNKNLPQSKLFQEGHQNRPTEQSVEEMKEMLINSLNIVGLVDVWNKNLPQLNLSKEDRKNWLIELSVEEMKQLPLCSACNKRPISDHHEEYPEGILHRCCQCNFFFREENCLLRHICMYHLSEPFYCKVCNLRYAEVESHEYEHPCNVCKEKFQCITQLEDHYLSHSQYHLNICRICNDEMIKHREEKDGSVFYKCCQKMCLKECNTKAKLKAHLFTHSNLKIFKCEFCQKRFSRKSNLDTHKKFHPTCGICKKMFMFKYFLEEHLIKEHL